MAGDLATRIAEMGLEPGELTEALRRAPYRVRRVVQRRGMGPAGRLGRYAYDPEGYVTDVLGETMWSRQREVLRSVAENERTAVPACFAPGKMVADYEPVLTPDGWKKHGHLRAGDLVFAQDGSPARVLAVFPQGVQALWRVTFTDSTSLDVGADHLWTVNLHYGKQRRKCMVCAKLMEKGSFNSTFCPDHRLLGPDGKHCSACFNLLPPEAFTRDASKSDGLRTQCRVCHQWRRNNGSAKARARDEWQVVTTQELLEYGGTDPVGYRRARIPMTESVEYPAVPVPIEPYVLGVLLGDGHLGIPTLTCADRWIVEAVGQHYKVSPRKSPIEYGVLGLKPALRSLGLERLRSWEKAVPTAYLRNEPTVRLAVLRGLMDTDGSVSEDGYVEFSSTSGQLAADVVELVQSLGGVARARVRQTGYTYKGERRMGRMSWRVRATMSSNPFALPRKAERWQVGYEHRQRPVQRRVERIRRVLDGAASCILVDHPSRAYLTKDHIVTHNTFSAARIALWWGDVWPLGTAQVVTTATSFRTVRGQLWPHIRRAHQRHNIRGRVNLTEWWVGNELVSFGFSAADSDPESVQGFHSQHLLVIVDEAGGISHAIGGALESLLTTGHVRIVAFGNPSTDEQDTWFERACSSPRWNVVPTPAQATPNFTGEVTDRCQACPPTLEAHSIASHLLTRSWVDGAVADFGKESAYVQAKVYARFPDIVVNRTIPVGWVEDAKDREVPAGLRVRLGVDVASDGGDELAIARMEGWTARVVHHSSGKHLANAVDVAGYVLEQILEAERVAAVIAAEAGASLPAQPVRVKVDAIGIGWGVTGILQRWRTEGMHDAEVVSVNVQERANDAERHRNQRAEMWWLGRELCQPADERYPGRDQWHLPDLDGRTAAQLSDPTYTTSSGGKRVIESKKSLRARGRSSPDRAEALLLAAYEPPEGERVEILV